MRVRLPEAVNVDGLQFEAGEHEIHDPYWLRALQNKLGQEVKLGADAPEYLRAEEENSLRYAKQSALAQLEAEMTRQEQWAPVLYKQLRDADAARTMLDRKGQMHGDAGKLRSELSSVGHDEEWNPATAFYHPDRTEAQPLSVPGAGPGPLNPSLEVTPEGGDDRVPVYTGEGSTESSSARKAMTESDKAHAPDAHAARPGDPTWEREQKRSEKK